jgi:hypothetical protein
MRQVREQAQVCQLIQRLVDIGFPELRDVWDDPTCDSALAVLRHASSAAAVARMHGPAEASGEWRARGRTDEGRSAQAAGPDLGGGAGTRAAGRVRDAAC